MLVHDQKGRLRKSWSMLQGHREMRGQKARCRDSSKNKNVREAPLVAERRQQVQRPWGRAVLACWSNAKGYWCSGPGLEPLENEYKGHVMWELGDHNRKSVFPLSGRGAPRVLRAEGGIP